MVFDPNVFDPNVFDTGEPTSKSDSDTGTGTDDASLAVALTDSDTAIGVDDAALDDGSGASPNDSETGSGADDASLAAAVSDSDTAAGADDGSLAATDTAAETGVGVDASALDKPESAAESGAGGEGGQLLTLDTAPGLAQLSGLTTPPVIRFDGVDITAHVQIEACEFRAVVNGGVGTARLPIRDSGRDLEFPLGRELTVDIEGQRVWGGYVLRVPRRYYYEGAQHAWTPRHVVLEAVDYNILFRKRFIYDAANPTRTQLKTFPAGTDDDVILKYYLANLVDLSGDGLDITSKIEHVGTPSRDSEISGAAGWSLGQFFAFISRNIGSIFYINPDKEVVYTDVDTPNAPFGLSDDPGEMLFVDEFDRVVADGWGSDYVADDMSNPGVTSVDGSVASVDALEYVAWNMPVEIVDERGQMLVDVWVPADPDDTNTYYELASGLVPIGGGFWRQCDISIFPTGAGNVWTVQQASSGSVNVEVDPSSWYRLWAIYDSVEDTVQVRFWKRGEAEPALQSLGAMNEGNNPNFSSLLWVFGAAAEASRVDNLIVRALEVGVRELEIENDADRMVNDMMVWGAGQGRSRVVFKRTQDQDSIDDHNRWQSGLFNPSIWRQATVNRIANSWVHGSPQNKRGGKDDRVSIRCATFEHGLAVAQKAPVRSAVFGYSDTLPIRDMRLTFASGVPRYDLGLGHDIDAPWSTFEFWFPRFDFDIPDDVEIPDFNPPPFDPCERTCWEFPADVVARVRMHRFDSNDPVICQIQISEEFGVTGGDNHGLVYLNFQGGDANDGLYVDVAGSGGGTPFASGSNDLFANSMDNVWFWVRLRLEESMVRVRVWLGELADEPASWMQQIAGSGLDPTALTQIVFHTELGETSADYIEIDEIRVYGYEYDRIETFERDEDGQLGISELTGEEWFDSTSNATIGVDGEKAQILSLGGTGAGSQFQVNMLCGETVGEAMGLFGSGAGCLETYTRTSIPTELATDGLGVDEIWDLPWPESNVYQTDGSNAYFHKAVVCSAGSGGYTAPYRLSGISIVSPLEYLFKIKTTRESTRVLGNTLQYAKWEFLLSDQATTGVLDPPYNGQYRGVTLVWRPGVSVNSGDICTDPGGPDRLDVGFRIFGTSNPVSSIGLIDATDIDVQDWMWLRFRVDADGLHAKIWQLGDAEPGSWSTELAGNFGGLTFTNQWYQYSGVNNQNFFVDQYEITEGLECDSGSPCEEDPPPEADSPCLGEWVRETLTPIGVPPGRPSDRTYFEASHQWSPSTESVFIDGLFIHPTEYIANYLLRYIEFEPQVDTAGKTVHMKYFATCIAVVEA